MIGARAISDKFSFAWLKQVQQRCKLYDYERHRWLDFSGRASSRITLAAALDSGRPVWVTRAAPA
ncbi:MAG: hypothetical protein HY018_13710 [Hydrogenophilales bacterium]|nr:hypothetical protein [Hydrogenophilales bacterium]